MKKLNETPKTFKVGDVVEPMYMCIPFAERVVMVSRTHVWISYYGMEDHPQMHEIIRDEDGNEHIEWYTGNIRWGYKAA